MKKIRLRTAPRTLILRVLARLHCGLIAGILFATAFAVLPIMTIPVRTSPEEAFWRGLLLAIPTALCQWAIKRLPALWQFLLAAAALCGLSWLLAGHPGGAAFMAIMCLFRVRARLAEADSPAQAAVQTRKHKMMSPLGAPGGATLSFPEFSLPATRSLFDNPSYFVLGLFLGAFLLSGFAGLPGLQKLALLGGVLYLLVCLGFRGLERLDRYLILNQDMHNLPARQIQRTSGAAVLAQVLLAAALLLPLALSSDGGIRYQLPQFNGAQVYPQQQEEQQEQNMEEPAMMDMDMDKLAPYATWQIPAWVTYIVIGFMGVAMLLFVLVMLRQLLRDFRHSYTDNRDYVQYLTKEGDTATTIENPPRRPSVWDRSPNAAIRRRYRKTILKAAKDAPSPWMSPEEAEAHAGVDAPTLHYVYEKARYGPNPCTNLDLKELR